MTAPGSSKKSALTLVQDFMRQSGRSYQAMVEISDRCNEVCVHCYQEQGNKGEMTTDEIRGLLDQFAQEGVLFLTLSGGEPTLRKDFVDILEHAHGHRFVTKVFTNGITMTAELAEQFHRFAVFLVEISVYSHRAETHDFVTGVPGSFVRTVAGIRHLRQAGVSVLIKTPVMSINEDDLDHYVQLARDLDADFRFDAEALRAREGGDRSPSVLSRSDPADRSVRERYGEHSKFGFVGPGRHDPTRAPCGAGVNVHVEPNGELRACSLLEIDLGNTREHGLSAVREGNETLDRIRTLSWGDLHGCRVCELSKYCQRCYASALNEVGDALGPYPSACASAIRNYEARNAVNLGFVAGEPLGLTGPFQFQSDGTCERVPDVRTEADNRLAQRFPWLRRAQVGEPPPRVGARPGELVQLRRPGQKKAIKQRIPSGVEHDRVAEPSRLEWATTGGTE